MKNHVLGTAQFGKKNYGISNFSNELKKEKKIQKILEQAWNWGIRTYDTAPGYGTEKLLGKFIKKKRIQTKQNNNKFKTKQQCGISNKKIY